MTLGDPVDDVPDSIQVEKKTSPKTKGIEK